MFNVETEPLLEERFSDNFLKRDAREKALFKQDKKLSTKRRHLVTAPTPM